MKVVLTDDQKQYLEWMVENDYHVTWEMVINHKTFRDGVYVREDGVEVHFPIADNEPIKPLWTDA